MRERVAFVLNLRSREEEAYAAVQSVLDGDHRAVRDLNLAPGDLQIFKGVTRHTE
jgi:hypothetical protein